MPILNIFVGQGYIACFKTVLRFHRVKMSIANKIWDITSVKATPFVVTSFLNGISFILRWSIHLPYLSCPSINSSSYLIEPGNCLHEPSQKDCYLNCWRRLTVVTMTFVKSPEIINSRCRIRTNDPWTNSRHRYRPASWPNDWYLSTLPT